MLTDENYCSACGQKRRRIDSSSDVANPNPPPPITILGDDLVVEILIRLPNPRSACSCKLVCKKWGSLLSTPYFNTRFAFAAAPAGNLITSHGRPPKAILSFLPPLTAHIQRRFRVFDCFKDLLLCGFSDNIQRGFASHTYMVCNPITKQWLALPLSPRRSQGCVVLAKLVCSEDYGEDQPPRGGGGFRVVFVYAKDKKTTIDVFCSESGEWAEKACVLKRERPCSYNVVSYNGKLFWLCGGIMTRPTWSSLVGFDPFRLDAPPTNTSLDHHPRPAGLASKTILCNISVSRGAMYVLRLLEHEVTNNTGSSLRKVLEVWRREEDGRIILKSRHPLDTSKCDQDVLRNYSACSALVLHPGDPKIVFLQFCYYCWCIVFSCDLRTAELKLFRRGQKNEPGWSVFQPRVVGWLPTPIPRYEELQSKHNGYFASLG